MAKFLKHTACEHCGSSDALAHYDDGGLHCFSCGYTSRPNKSAYVIAKEQGEDGEKVLTMPSDLGFEYEPVALKWALQYTLTAGDLIKNKVYWSKKYQQLVYVYPKMDNTGIGCIQARNFNPDAKTKYFNQGDASQVLPIYTSTNRERTLVIVEDAISAIRVSEYMDAVPLLGSYLPITKVVQVVKLAYDKVILWLDHDKYVNAATISQQFKWVGLDSRVIVTPLDPKEYTINFIKDKLK